MTHPSRRPDTVRRSLLVAGAILAATVVTAIGLEGATAAHAVTLCAVSTGVTQSATTLTGTRAGR
jgi:hypothetical protein